MVKGLEFRVLSFRFQVSGFRFRVQAVRVSAFQIYNIEYRI
jgi:hypothetical protein